MTNQLTRNFLAAIGAAALATSLHSEEMDKMWGDNVVKLRPEDAKRGQLFADGNYAMFIHWGLYSHLANKVDGKTYYGIGEWIMNPRMAGIPVPKYKEIAKDFNPVNFDAKAVAQLAKDAGMKYIIITSKHHDGFAMYDSKVSDFNIVDATPFKRDPMKELAAACKEIGIGFGFYYSHNQDWTFPGGNGGPPQDAEGNPKDFGDYFEEKCFDQVNEITTEYGQIEIVWFDTPGEMPKEYVEKLCDLVYKNQPNAFISGRAGHGLGDYQSLGDMEVPVENVEGLWETVDTTNDSWAFAWYDENYKTPKTILGRVIATVARGGTYMLNVGLKGDGSIPERAADGLRGAGEWIAKYPQVVYGTDASPWGHALPWGDATVKNNTVFLSVFEWPGSKGLYLPGLKTKIKSAKLLGSDAAITFEEKDGWVKLSLPCDAPEKLVSVIELEMDGKPEADHTFGLDPNVTTRIEATFATASEKGVKKSSKRWMEKFGEWKHVDQFSNWQEGGAAVFEVNVLEPGDYQVDLKYAGEERLVWKVAVEGGETMQNQQNSSHNYASFPIGWTNFPKAGKYKINVSCIEGETKTASLAGISFTRIP
ncbi:MAG: alpha-L-fucosidase [Akkermansiaceae bacterium]|nr:alpha-L-fucosidase [Akkermansiaceae bacterium]MDP4779206.1 alpha-L-fucosidase [Akkermansiaceae bacterium]MDP4848180.1 alpha-L-fucosidase [Akkermansiaceae bacterium]MDP4995237.1 alpha-L-fucosidase [Akkermansiaceae bacterium]